MELTEMELLKQENADLKRQLEAQRSHGKPNEEYLSELGELQRLCRPLSKYMRQHFASGEVLVIDTCRARIVCDKMCVPFSAKL